MNSNSPKFRALKEEAAHPDSSTRKTLCFTDLKIDTDSELVKRRGKAADNVFRAGTAGSAGNLYALIVCSF